MVRVVRDLVDVVSDVPDFRPDGLQLLNAGTGLACLPCSFEIATGLMRLDQVTRDADASLVRGRTDFLKFLVGDTDEDSFATGLSRPELLVPAHRVHAPFHLSGHRS